MNDKILKITFFRKKKLENNKGMTAQLAIWIGNELRLL
jgi:hypothetical protein